MRKNDWALYTVAATFGAWALAMLLRPLAVQGATDYTKLFELTLSTASAVGTVGAVIVALYFGLRGQLEKRTHERKVAVVVATRLEAKLHALDLDIELLEQCFDDSPLADQFRTAHTMVRHLVAQGLQNSFSDAELLALEPLVPGAAVNVARAIQCLDEAMKTINSGFPAHGIKVDAWLLERFLEKIQADLHVAGTSTRQVQEAVSKYLTSLNG